MKQTDTLVKKLAITAALFPALSLEEKYRRINMLLEHDIIDVEEHQSLLEHSRGVTAY